MDITNHHDYIAHKSYKDHKRICSASGFKTKKEFNWDQFWVKVSNQIDETASQVVFCRRVNPFSPASYHIAFFSRAIFYPTDQFNIIKIDEPSAKALCTLLNSSIFYSQFFLLKEESTGRYLDIRLYDLSEMNLLPKKINIPSLVKVFDLFKNVSFPPLKNQFDKNFDERYKEFWSQERNVIVQGRLWSALEKNIDPSPERFEFDLAVMKAIGMQISKQDLINNYAVFVKEMIMIRGLTND